MDHHNDMEGRFVTGYAGYDPVGSSVGARWNATRAAQVLRGQVMAPLVGLNHPMPQTREIALAVMDTAAGYMNPEHREVFLEMVKRRIPGAFCLQSITDAKEAADFIISGKV